MTQTVALTGTEEQLEQVEHNHITTVIKSKGQCPACDLISFNKALNTLDSIETKIDYFQGAPLGQLVYDRTYSRIKPDGNKETWADTCRRVVDGNLAFVEERFHESDEREELYKLLLNRQLIPAGRHLWVTGVKDRQFTQNCHTAGFETGLAEHCGFVFSELMKGGGVGANYSNRYLSALTPLSSVEVRFVCSSEHADYESLLPLLSDPFLEPGLPTLNFFRIPDSREGWVESLELLIDAATNSNKEILVFDVSKVRGKGCPIRGFGGTASGPEPLIRMLLAISRLFPCRITPDIAMEIDHLIAGAVIAGNVRRSARMSIVHWKDPFILWFLDCKADHTDHWSTNISVEVDDEFFRELLDKDSVASYVYERIIDGMVRDGEPGFYNSSLASKGERTHLGATNPCGEMPLESWESCNLGHVNLAFGDSNDHRRSFRLMARFLIRSSFCDIQDPKQRDVVERNRRIGVGFFGLQEWLGLRGIPYSEFNRHGILADNLSEWHNIVRTEADEYADELGINRPVKCTTLAPTGSIAKLAGTTESMQASYAKYILRRVRYASNDPEVLNLIRAGIDIEMDIANPNTIVASFPCEDPILTRMPVELVQEQHEIPFESVLELQALIQRYYADNAISCTINVPSDNCLGDEGCGYRVGCPNYEIRDRLSKAINKYLPHIKGTTVFPEASRPQSPIERITKEKYNEMIATNAMVESGIKAGESEQLLEECQGGACPIR